MTNTDMTTNNNGSAQKTKLKLAVFSAAQYVHDFLEIPLESNFTDVTFIPAQLNAKTAPLAQGYDAVCLFVNDNCSAEVVDILADGGVKLIAQRCAGFDRVDVKAANAKGIRVVRVPAYSPRSVAEFALTMIMASARNLKLAVQKVSIGDYTLDGLVGSEISGKTYGIIGTGKIGVELIKLLKGFDGRVLAYDVYESEVAKANGAQYTDVDTLLKESDVISLHTPLLESTRHMINSEKLSLMKQDAILVNVSRGGLIDTGDLIRYLELGDDNSQETGGKLSGVAMDVYEDEETLFFEDFTRYPASYRMKKWDNRFTLLKALPQVMVTPHIAFLTHEALGNIADTTIENLKAFAAGGELVNEVKV